MMDHPYRGLRRLSATLAILFTLAACAAALPMARPAAGATPAQATLAQSSRRVIHLPLVAGATEAVIPPQQVFNTDLFLRPVPLQQVQRGSIISVEYRYTNNGPGIVAGDNFRLFFRPSPLLIFDNVNAAPGDGHVTHDGQAVTVAVRNVQPGETRTGRVTFYVRGNAGEGERIVFFALFTCSVSQTCESNLAEVEVVRNDNENPSGGAFTMSVTPDRGPPGTAHTFQGFGFIPGEEYRTWLNTPSGVMPLAITGRADASGRIWFTFGSGQLSVAGFYSMVAHGVRSGVENIGPFIVQINGLPAARAAAPTAVTGGAALAEAGPTRAEPAQTPRGNGGIGGRVLDIVGTGVAGVVVEVRDSNASLVATARSAPNGVWFVATGLASGDYTARALPGTTNNPDLAFYGSASSAPTAVVAPALTGGVDLVLPAAGALRGSLGESLQDVRVLALQAGAVVDGALSDATGVYTLTNLAPGNYSLKYDPRAARRGGALNIAERTGIAVVAGETTQVGAVTRSFSNLKGTISGKVTGPGGAGVADVIVVITNLADNAEASGQLVRVTRTDAEGVYSSEALPLGRYRVQFLTLFSRNTATSRLIGKIVEPVDLSTGGAVEQNAQLIAGGTISGVVSGAGAGGLADVFVLAKDAEGMLRATTRSAEDGAYALGGLAAGAYTVEFVTTRALGEAVQAYASGVQTAVAVAEGAALTNINITLSLGSRISGLALAGDSSDGLAGVRVVFLAAPTGGPTTVAGATLTDAEGRYSSPGLAPGRYKVFFTTRPAPDTQTRTYQYRFYGNVATLEEARVIEIGATRRTALANVILEPGGAISGRVSVFSLTREAGERGEGLAGVFVVARDAESDALLGGAVSDSEGRYELPGLRPGTVRLTFDPIFAPSTTVRTYAGTTLGPLTVELGKTLTDQNVALELTAAP